MPSDTVTIRMMFDAEFALGNFTQSLADLLIHPQILGRLLQRAVAETVLVAVQRRFLQNLPNALEMEPRDFNKKLRARDTGEMQEMEGLFQQLREAQGAGNTAVAQQIQTQIQHRREAFIKSLQRGRYGGDVGRGVLSSGKFRPLALDVLHKLTDVQGAHIFALEGGGVGVSFGSQSELNLIRTPSATQYVLKRGRTSSKFDILWRHLEFGTGVYSTDPFGRSHPPTRYTMASHYWAYSKRPPKGLVLKGSQPMHFLRDATGAMYDEDALKFTAVFGAFLMEELSGSPSV